MLVDDSGKACITDFGLSKVCSSGTSATQMGKVSGTLRFLAPEALSGHPLTLETDVYAFGMVIYEVLHDSGAFFAHKHGVDRYSRTKFRSSGSPMTRFGKAVLNFVARPRARFMSVVSMTCSGSYFLNVFLMSHLHDHVSRPSRRAYLQ